MPQLIRFMLFHGALGFGISAGFVALLVGTDTGGLAALLHGAETHPLPALLLWFLCGLTFGSVQIGTALMLLEADEEPPTSTRIPAAIPIRVSVPGRARRR
jgi:hypothetical protein